MRQEKLEASALLSAWKEWLGRGADVAQLKPILRGRDLSPSQFAQNDFARFQNCFEYVEFDVAGKTIWFPRKKPDGILKGVSERPRPWNERGWFHPPYLSRGLVRRLLETDQFDELLANGYSLLHLATMWNQGFRELSIFERFCPVIFESIEAHALGLEDVAVSSLVPVIEGTLRELQDRLGFAGESITDRLEHFAPAVAENAGGWFYQCDWLPRRFRSYDYLKRVDEFVWLVDGYVLFLKEHLFADTDNFQNPSELNRHGILHGLFDSYGSRTNFFMLYSMLEMHAFITNLTGENQFLLFPEMNEHSEKTSLYLGGLDRLSSVRKTVSQRITQQR